MFQELKVVLENKIMLIKEKITIQILYLINIKNKDIVVKIVRSDHLI